MDFENEIDLNELSERINNLRELEDQENSPGLPDEYRNMDKLTIIKMLLASQHENEKLHAKLDKQDEEAKAREERLNVRIDELTRVNTISSESQIKLMDQLTELHHQLKQMGGQYSDLLVELKRQKDLNRQSGKEKYATTKQNVKKDDQDKDDSDDGQRGSRVRQADDFNGDPKTLKDVCNNVPQTPKEGKKPKEIREYSIDNNIAERNVRPATVKRKNSLSFASEDGIECSATYHTIVQTCRMMGVRVLKYFQSFFKTFKDGCRDFMNMLPGKLAID